MTGWIKTVVFAGMCGSLCARGQQSLAEANRLCPAAVVHVEPAESPAPATSVDDAFHALFAQADVAFAGTVVKIERTSGAVVVRFHVEDAIRGVAPGATFLLVEWSGLWADDPARYVEGERRLMLLHAASSAGYASPVGGSRGAIRLRGDSAQQSADLRWIASGVVAASPSIRAVSVSSSTADQSVPENSAVDGAMILDMLHAWQRAEVLR